MAPDQPPAALFNNSDGALRRQALAVARARREAGLDGLVGDLQCLVINSEADRQEAAVRELLRYTGYEFAHAFEDAAARTCVLRCPHSADILVRARRAAPNPFAAVNAAPKTGSLPNTRLETFVFETPDLARCAQLQAARGVQFLSEDLTDAGDFLFIQTCPSAFTGNSIGYIQWRTAPHRYLPRGARALPLSFPPPAAEFRRNIRHLDHVATRVRAADRDPAILEFMWLTGYDFDFAIYVENLNSITNVARRPGAVFAQVFTSGLAAYQSEELSGPTEKFVHQYGPRVHHMAFQTEEIDATFAALKSDGMSFLVELVGSPAEGLKQTFSAPSPHTMIVNEYIHRYGDFTGFFTLNNVAALTEATGKQ